MHTINLPYKQGYVTPVPAAVVVNTYEFREAEDPSLYNLSRIISCCHSFEQNTEGSPVAQCVIIPVHGLPPKFSKIS